MKLPLTKPTILFVTSYPPRACGIATFSQDLIKALKEPYGNSYDFKVCALEDNATANAYLDYPPEVIYRINTDSPESIAANARLINDQPHIEMLCIQHEFGLWGPLFGQAIVHLLNQTSKRVITVFHTVIPTPEDERYDVIAKIADRSYKLIVMTKRSARLLQEDYDVSAEQIAVIPHGTHPVPWRGQRAMKDKYGLSSNLVLSTFGLLGPNKNIETTLLALPALVQEFPTIKFLILGRTHPGLVQQEGEAYREKLLALVEELRLQEHVVFVNKYLSLTELLEYLKLTDIYVFSSKDRLQAVSGTFAYALSCGSPVVSTPIPHALEVLDKKAGVFFEFENPGSLITAIRPLLSSFSLRKKMALHGYQITRASTWQNTAIAYGDILKGALPQYQQAITLPGVNLSHLKRMTDDFGIIQFSKIGKPDPLSGYTIDDNARALIAMVMHYNMTGQACDLKYIDTYLQFINYCRIGHSFKNYVDQHKAFQPINNYVNLEDSNARAAWALGYVVAHEAILPSHISTQAEGIFKIIMSEFSKVRSPRAIAFTIKGLYYYYQTHATEQVETLIRIMADKLVKHYLACADEKWAWFENYLTYANAVLPEALIYAYQVTKKNIYMKIGMNSLNFLLAHTLHGSHLEVITNRGWLKKGGKLKRYGEQPIEVTCTVLALKAYYQILGINRYRQLLHKTFSWFLGNNALRQVMYDPVSGGCYDGLEEHGVNLNQGAESAVCYLIARMSVNEKVHITIPGRSKALSESERHLLGSHKATPKV